MIIVYWTCTHKAEYIGILRFALLTISGKIGFVDTSWQSFK